MSALAGACLALALMTAPTVEQANAQEAQAQTGRWAPTEDYNDLEEVVFAEAGNQGYHGMRLVTAVILNRVDDERFPDTIEEVLSQPGQFQSRRDGGVEKWRDRITDECRQAVADELSHRTDSTILYFTAGQYNPSGEPAYRYLDHYFSR